MNSNEVHSGAVEAISDRLLAGRHSAQELQTFPGQMPEDFDTAYAVQDRSRNLWDDEVAGWKIGLVPPDLVDKYGASRVFGPIFNGNVHHAANGSCTKFGAYPGFAAIEAEFVIQLGETSDEDRMFIGVEIASSVLQDVMDMGPVAVICDFGNNGGLIVGPEVTDWRSVSGNGLTIRTDIDGTTVGEKEVTTFPADALTALQFLRDHCEARGIDLPVGSYASTGAITGVHRAFAGQSATADFGKLGRLDIELFPAEPIVG